jgi:hypothetical protein
MSTLDKRRKLHYIKSTKICEDNTLSENKLPELKFKKLVKKPASVVVKKLVDTESTNATSSTPKIPTFTDSESYSPLESDFEADKIDVAEAYVANIKSESSFIATHWKALIVVSLVPVLVIGLFIPFLNWGVLLACCCFVYLALALSESVANGQIQSKSKKAKGDWMPIAWTTLLFLTAVSLFYFTSFWLLISLIFFGFLVFFILIEEKKS